MKIETALANVTHLFLDTAPIIYFVEENPAFLAIVNFIFDYIEAGTITGITSAITLAECLVIPYRNNNIELQHLASDSPPPAKTQMFTTAILRLRDRQCGINLLVPIHHLVKIAGAIDRDGKQNNVLDLVGLDEKLQYFLDNR